MADLKAEHDPINQPHWHIWRSEKGSWLATRTDRYGLTDQELHRGLEMTLMEESLHELGKGLARQAEIEGAL